MITILNAYAEPFERWASWVIDPQAYDFPATVTVSAVAVTQMASIFTGQAEYFARDSDVKIVHWWECPGSTRLKLDFGLQQLRFRFRGTLTGFQVRVTVNDHLVMVRPQDDTTKKIGRYPKRFDVT